MRALGIVGLGLVGSAIARRARAAGAMVVGLDVEPARVAALADLGVSRAADLAALASASEASGAIVVAVYDGAQLVEVVRALAACQAKPQAIASVVTADIASVEQAIQIAARAGIDFIEAPYSGSSAQIERGEATVLVGAADDSLARHAPLLALLGDDRVHVGAAGMAARAKLASNLVLGLSRAALAEGIVFCEALGLDPSRLIEVMRRSPAYTRLAEIKGGKMVRGDFAVEGRLEQHAKDVAVILDEARRRALDLPLSRTHAVLLGEAVDAGDGELDNSAVVIQLRRGRA